jgi:hypothetical protein
MPYHSGRYFNDRFVLRFTEKTLGIDDVSPPENTIIISKYKMN